VVAMCRKVRMRGWSRKFSFPLALRPHLPPRPAHPSRTSTSPFSTSTSLPSVTTICILNPTSFLGLEILTQLLIPSSLSSVNIDDSASKIMSPSFQQRYHIKAIIEPLYNARDLDDLIHIQNQLSSSPLHSLDIFEVNSLIPNSYTKILQNCDYV
jgi:hypothetical protein